MSNCETCAKSFTAKTLAKYGGKCGKCAKAANGLNSPTTTTTIIKTTTKLTKAKIPKKFKEMAWRQTIGDKLAGPCYVCNTEISFSDFHAGHIISEYSGGKTTPDNLRPICKSCNLSCGVMNLDDFKQALNNQPTAQQPITQPEIKQAIPPKPTPQTEIKPKQSTADIPSHILPALQEMGISSTNYTDFISEIAKAQPKPAETKSPTVDIVELVKLNTSPTRRKDSGLFRKSHFECIECILKDPKLLSAWQEQYKKTGGPVYYSQRFGLHITDY
jgi:hypothetical protein